MTQPTYQGSTAAELIEFARANGVSLPDDTDKSTAWKAVKALLNDLGETVTDTSDSGDQSETQATESTAAVSGRAPTHFTVKIQKPQGVTVGDMIITANGVNTQIQFNKEVKISAAAYHALNDAVEQVPGYRDPETQEWNPPREEPRYAFLTVKEHFE